MISTLDRSRGAMLGVLAGDALGASYEKKRGEEVRADFDRRGGLVVFDYIDPHKGKRQMRAGQPTDDSELSAALAQSIVACRGLNERDAYDRLRRFIHGRESILTDGEVYGSGGTLREALRPETYEGSCALFDQGAIPVIPSNGSLMRGIAVPIAYRYDVYASINVARRQSCITHVHDTAQAACMMYTVLVSYILDGYTPQMAWEEVQWIFCNDKDYDGHSGVQEILSLPISEPTDDDIWPNSGGAAISFRAALWASLTATDFRDGLTKVIGLGGDTDTYGAIAGGILGAYFGDDGIPQEWCDALIGRDIMVNLADELHALAGEE
ncbi:hypothetical protein FJY93_04210 [Candidatus Kaiserbacteria bacterium]|nr:hypothetical protein [Candidatus Kaiserbacteria bacterium]